MRLQHFEHLTTSVKINEEIMSRMCEPWETLAVIKRSHRAQQTEYNLLYIISPICIQFLQLEIQTPQI